MTCPKWVRSGAVFGRIEIEVRTGFGTRVDVGVEDRLLFADWSGQHLTGGRDDDAAAADSGPAVGQFFVEGVVVGALALSGRAPRLLEVISSSAQPTESAYCRGTVPLTSPATLRCPNRARRRTGG